MIIDSIRVALINYQRAVILKEKDGERYLPTWIDVAQLDAITTGPQKPILQNHLLMISFVLSSVT